MNGVTTAMFRERPVARLSAALEATKPISAAAAATRALVADDTEPRPERAREAVDLDTFASFATSASVLAWVFPNLELTTDEFRVPDCPARGWICFAPFRHMFEQSQLQLGALPSC